MNEPTTDKTSLTDDERPLVFYGKEGEMEHSPREKQQ